MDIPEEEVRFYALQDGRVWDIENVQFVKTRISDNEDAIQDVRTTHLIASDGSSDIKYLAKTLAFYDYPLGELVIFSEKGIKEELDRLDSEYLTPRVLAGLATGDEFAMSQWIEHEQKAKPLRERLAELEAES